MKKITFGIDCGHNCPPRDTGAVGIGNECLMTREIGSLVMSKIAGLGHNFVDCTPAKASTLRDSLLQRCQVANDAKVDVFVSIHFNAFNGRANGTEVYFVSSKGKSIATNVVNAIAGLGFKNRGAKYAEFFVLKHTNMPAILVEGCFLDSQVDMSIYEPESMSSAIVAGLIA